MVHIRAIVLKNFKTYKSLELRAGEQAGLHDGFNVLCGVNGAGKSWAGSGRYRKGPQNPHRFVVVLVFLFGLFVVVCWYM